LLSFTGDGRGRHRCATGRLEPAATAPLAHQVGVQAKRQSNPGNRRARLVAGRQDLTLELRAVPAPRELAMFVHLLSI
jgi:hypothetical protein